MKMADLQAALFAANERIEALSAELESVRTELTESNAKLSSWATVYAELATARAELEAEREAGTLARKLGRGFLDGYQLLQARLQAVAKLPERWDVGGSTAAPEPETASGEPGGEWSELHDRMLRVCNDRLTADVSRFVGQLWLSVGQAEQDKTALNQDCDKLESELEQEREARRAAEQRRDDHYRGWQESNVCKNGEISELRTKLAAAEVAQHKLHGDALHYSDQRDRYARLLTEARDQIKDAESAWEVEHRRADDNYADLEAAESLAEKAEGELVQQFAYRRQLIASENRLLDRAKAAEAERDALNEVLERQLTEARDAIETAASRAEKAESRLKIAEGEVELYRAQASIATGSIAEIREALGIGPNTYCPDHIRELIEERDSYKRMANTGDI